VSNDLELAAGAEFLTSGSIEAVAAFSEAAFSVFFTAGGFDFLLFCFFWDFFSVDAVVPAVLG
jgi:hypothetical protein